MHLFLREGRLPPSEIGHNFRPVGKGFMAPKPHHSRVRRGIPRRPIYWPRLLFHDPPTVPATAIEIVMERLKIGVTGPQIPILPVPVAAELLQKSQRIGIPGGHIKVRRYVEMIEFQISPHEIVNELAAR